MGVGDLWPPHRCFTVTSTGETNLGDAPAGEYTISYMKGALALGPMPKDRLYIWFTWDGDSDLDAQITFLGKFKNGYYCWYSCNEECNNYINWYGTPNYHEDPGQGTAEYYGIALYESWEEGLWRGDSTTINVYAWWYYSKPGSNVVLHLKWAWQELEWPVSVGSNCSKNQYDACGGCGEGMSVGTITAYAGGFFEFK